MTLTQFYCRVVYCMYTCDLTQISRAQQTTQAAWRQNSVHQVHVFLHKSIYRNIIRPTRHSKLIMPRKCENYSEYYPV